MGRMGRAIAVVAAVLALAVPSAASGAQRFAAPGGGLTPGCPQAAPCSLELAISGAAPGDEVIVTPGTYSVAAPIETETPLWVHGQDGAPRPRLVAAPEKGVFKSFAPQRIGYLTLETTNSIDGALFVPADGTILERLEVLARGPEALGLRIGNNFTLTDSLVFAGPGENAAGVFVQGTANGAPQLRNDTILAQGSKSIGVSIFVTKAGATVAMSATNVIAGGDTDASALVGSEATGGSATIAFDHSNLDSSEGSVTSTNGQTVPPLFVSAAAGDFHQAIGSPTIDAGLTDAANGPLDLDGNPRALPAANTCTEPDPAITDIGAYEFVPAPVTCIPQTKITKFKRRGHRAKVRFTATGTKEAVTFKCKLDKRRWRPCRSPKKYKHLKAGRHVIKVRAFAGGQQDPTPAKRKFRVRS